MKTFRDAVRHKDFAVSAEIFLRPDSNAESILHQASLLAEHVDGILLTDNQFGQLHLSTLAAASILIGAGIDPVVQLTSRNRNRIALISDLLGAGAIGVTSLLLSAGERPPESMNPRPKPVMDLRATELIRTAATIRDSDSAAGQPDFLVGGVAMPIRPGPNWNARKLHEKVDAGAQFMQTHTCMDVDLLRSYLRRLVTAKLIHRTSVIVSVAVLESADDARWLKENRSNVIVPDALISRLEGADYPREEGIRICAETVHSLREIPGVAGISIMASRNLEAIPAVLQRVGPHD